ncbi:hypothetical protein GPALN_006140 [Globodera pallida]|uniref:GLOBIN domain-containing protein n=1 Tax=Globodera pallida TaxID=36090 RepID=A0A183BQ10_GLOPA|nr:hypothetical protein GPALN_006140 [Globodera pallida]
MGSSLCKPREAKKSRIVASSSWVSNNENDNPFERSFAKKERICLRETFHRLTDPKEVIGLIFVDIVNDLCPEFKRIFGVERAPKATMLKMPKLGGHVSRMADFIEQMTLMIGFTENLAGAWQLVRKTGRLHAKVPFLEQNQSQMGKNYIALVNEHFIEHFIPFLTGEKSEPIAADKSDGAAERKKPRLFHQNFSQQTTTDVWRRFFTLCTAQMTEAFELERQKCLNADNQKTLAPHQQTEEAERRRRINIEKANEMEALPQPKDRRQEELFEDPF